MGLKWDARQGDNLTGLEIPEPPHTYGYIHGDFGYMNDKQVAIGESTHRLPAEDGEPDARAQVRHHHADAPGHGAGRHGPRGHPGHGRAGREVRLRVHRHRRDAGRGRPERGLGVRDHARRPAVDARRAASPGRSGAPSASPTTTSPSARTSRGSARSTSRTRTIFMASPNVVSLAVSRSFYDPKSGKPFNWKRAYSPNDGERRRLGRRPGPDVAVLRPRRPVAEVQPRDAQHGLPLLGQARQEALRLRRHGR